MEVGKQHTKELNDLQPVIDQLPGLVWTALPDGQFDFLNRRWCEYTGVSAVEGHGNGWQASIYPEDLPGLIERWRSILASAEPGEMEARLRRFDGEYRWFLFRFWPLADGSAQFVRWCGIITDIDDRKRAEEDLRVRERRSHAPEQLYPRNGFSPSHHGHVPISQFSTSPER